MLIAIVSGDGRCSHSRDSGLHHLKDSRCQELQQEGRGSGGQEDHPGLWRPGLKTRPVTVEVRGFSASAWLPRPLSLGGFRPFDKLRAGPSSVEGRLQPEGS